VLSDSLKVYLASTFAYYLKAHYFHWNVEGSDFGQLHKFFQKIYEDSYKALDPIAEFIRTTDDYAPGSLERFQELSIIPGQTKVPRAKLMLAELLVNTESMIDLTVQSFATAQAEQREDIANFLAERQASLGKYRWQIKSYLNEARA
jgi:starvation-inducible DNA-binding protein